MLYKILQNTKSKLIFIFCEYFMLEKDIELFY